MDSHEITSTYHYEPIHSMNTEELLMYYIQYVRCLEYEFSN